jgi:hypothetical protein
MPSELKKTVKPSGGDYTSLEACMNANEQDLVANDKYFIVEIDGVWSSPDTTPVNIHNYVTDADHYIHIYTTATARHNGIDTSGYTISYTWVNYVILCQVAYVTIEGLVIKLAMNSQYGRPAVLINQNNDIIRQCIVRSSNAGSGYASGIYLGGSNGSKVYALNCIVIAKTSAFIHNGGGSPPANHYAYNCTAYGAVLGFEEGYGSNYVKNCLAIGNTTDYSGGWASMVTCGSGDATGTAGLQGLVAGTEFVDVTPGSEDLKLKAGATSIDKGTDLGTSPSGVNFDILDRDRDAQGDTWDLGAHEYVSLGVKVAPEKGFISGYHCFMSQYLRAKVGGLIPLKLPDGTVF